MTAEDFRFGVFALSPDGGAHITYSQFPGIIHQAQRSAFDTGVSPIAYLCDGAWFWWSAPPTTEMRLAAAAAGIRIAEEYTTKFELALRR